MRYMPTSKEKVIASNVEQTNNPLQPTRTCTLEVGKLSSSRSTKLAMTTDGGLVDIAMKGLI